MMTTLITNDPGKEWNHHALRAGLVDLRGLLGSSSVGAQQAPAEQQEDASDFAEEEAPEFLAAKLLDCDRPASNWAEVLNARIKAGEPLPAWPGCIVMAG